MMKVLCTSIVALLPIAASAQWESPYMDRARKVLAIGLGQIGQWQTTHTTNQTVMQCTSCAQVVTVVLRQIDDYTKGSDFTRPMDLYMAGRKALCRDLAADQSGRCLDLKAPGFFSLEQDDMIYEFVTPLGTSLLAGYVEGQKDATELPQAQNILRQAVKALSPLW